MNEFDDRMSQGDSRKRPNNRQVRLLFEELEVILKHPRAADIMLGEWFYNDDLSVPSTELLEFFAWDLLCGFGRMARFLETGNERQHAVGKYVVELQSMPEDSRWNSIVYAVARRRIAELGGARLHVLHWWPALTSMGLDTDELPQIQDGKRRLARFVLELMTLRATFMSESLYLEGLVEAVRSKPQKPQASHEIAFRMLEWHPYLTNELERVPSRMELEVFLKEVYPDVSDSSATWTEARKLVALRTAEPRRRKIDRDQIITLARNAGKVGPKVVRLPSWRKLPFFGAGEDVQK